MAAKDNKDKENAWPEGQAEKPKKKSRAKKLIIIFALLFLILGCAGLGAYWWFFMRAPAGEGEIAEETTQESAENVARTGPGESSSGEQSLNSARIERQSDLPRSGGMVLPLPPITVNLNDPNGRRYLKLGMEVEVNADVSSQLKSQNPRIRDAIIMLLAGKTYGEVSSPDGKVMLKAEIAARLNQILGAPRVMRIYFTDFVVE